MASLTQSNSTLHFLDKMNVLVAKSQRAQDPSAKERRYYAVELMDSLVDLCRDLQLDGPKYGKNFAHFPFSPTNSAYYPTEVCNFLLSGYYEMIDAAHHDRLLPIRLSNKTVVRSPELGYGTMKEVWTRVHRSLSPRRSDIAVNFSSALQLVCNQEGLTALPANFTDVMPQVLDDLVNLVSVWKDHLMTPDERARVWREKYSRLCLMSLKERYYFTRGDYRAFIVDKDMVRAFTGAIIQAINQPSNMTRRKMVWTSSIMPVRDRDKLDITRYVRDGQSAAVVLGDVSSFSANSPNGWASVLVQCLLLKGPLKSVDQPTVVTVNGYPFEIIPSDILAQYLYLTVLADAQDMSRQEMFTCTGGFLGVSGNMTVTLLAFCLEHYLLRQELDTLKVAQVGGDDFFQLYTGHFNPLVHDIEISKARLSRTQGKIRDLSVTHLSSLDYGCHKLPLEFCKKTVIITVTPADLGTNYRILTEPSIPIPTHLFEDYSLKTAVEIDEKFQECMRSVELQSEWLPDRPVFLSFVAKLFIKVHSPKHWCLPYPVLQRWPGDILYQEGMYLTMLAHTKVQTVRPILASNHNVLRTSLRARVIFSLTTGALKARKVIIDGSGKSIKAMVFYHKSEQKLALKEPLTSFSMRCDSPLEPLVLAIEIIRNFAGEVEVEATEPCDTDDLTYLL